MNDTSFHQGGKSHQPWLCCRGGQGVLATCIIFFILCHIHQNEAVKDFKKRIAHYEEQYQTLDENYEPHLSFLKIFNCGKKVSVYQHEGHIQSRIVYFLMNLHLQVRTKQSRES